MPSNTPGGFPWPLPTEPVAEGAAAIRALAEAADAKVERFLGETVVGANGLLSFTVPANIRWLRLLWYAATAQAPAAGFDSMFLRFNNSTATYSWVWGYDELTSHVATANAADNWAPIGFVGINETIASGEVIIPTPSAPSTKNYLARAHAAKSGASGRIVQAGGIWFPGAAITSIQFYAGTSPFLFKAGSRLVAYGTPA